jgi:mono/diheme cytochrome c family protein
MNLSAAALPAATATLAALVLAVMGGSSARSEDAPPEPTTIDFDRDVKPIFAKHCISCHGPEKQKNGLRLDRKADAAQAFVPGKSADSLLFQLVTGQDKDRPMPPKGRLSDAEIAVLKAWIDEGAKWPDDGSGSVNPADWWSFKPLAKPAVPGGVNPIDHFIRKALSDRGLSPSPEADRRTLIRRLYFDLVGLPPAPGEVETFINDPAPNAYEKLVDRLLSSPHYGERWARHWLDVVHFGETHGYDKDKPRPNAWPYRDYVIRSLNADKPYRQFVQEQVAGDVLYPGTVDGIEALGFLAAGPWDFIGHAELPESKIDGKIARHLDRDDFVANTIGTFMGLTVHCAQCHNHKFDPISQEDYYRLQAVFAAIDRTDKQYDSDPRVAKRRAELRRRYASSSAIVGTAAAEPIRQALAALPAPRVAYIGTIHTGLGTFTGTGALGGRPRPISILSRGDVTKPLKEVGPGAINAIPGVAGRFELPATHFEGERRAALARWLTDKANPLTWRVMANRVWQYHFGRGLVDTPNDFGRMGQPPTHPELLDYLAIELRDHQSLKRLHKLIAMSETYRQSSNSEFGIRNAESRGTVLGLSIPQSSIRNPQSVDADNRYLWRQNRRKLEAEAVRDSILMVAGKLDLRMGGPSFQDFVIEKPEHSPHYQYHLHDPEDTRAHRRAIYRFVVRSKQQPFMAALDCADPSLAVEKRNETLTPQQALALLNNKLAVAMAKHFAARVEKMGRDDGERVSAAMRLALGREPTPNERGALSAYAKEHGLANACRVILNLNEFVFVD